METDLGAVSGIGNNVEVALVSAQQDIDSAYQDALDNIRIKRARVDPEEVPYKPEAKEQKQKDIYANFRTNLLLLWSLSNALLAGIVLAGADAAQTFQGNGDNRTGIYMLVILGENIRWALLTPSLRSRHGCLPLPLCHPLPHYSFVWWIDSTIIHVAWTSIC